MLLNLIPNMVCFHAFSRITSNYSLLYLNFGGHLGNDVIEKRALTIIFILTKILTLGPYEPNIVETRHGDLFSGCRCVQPNRGIFATTKKERKFQRAITLSKIVRFC